MSGAQLVKRLHVLGYPGADSLEPQALDWMFENDALSPLLHWFCTSINTSNVLSDKQLNEYAALSNSGEVVLKGRQLEEALSSLDFSKDETASEESLKEEVEQLESSLRCYQQQKHRLAKRRNTLSNLQMTASQRLSRLGHVKSRAEQEYKAAVGKTHTANTQMDDSLELVGQAVGDLSLLYRPPANRSGDTSLRPTGNASLNATQAGLSFNTSHNATTNTAMTAIPCMFLSQTPVQQYHSAEETYTTQLTAYTKKQFFQGIAEMASCGGDSRFEILEVSDPDSLLVRGEREDVNMQDCRELARLQKLYAKSETERIKATCEMTRLKGQLESAKGILSSLDSGTFCNDGMKNKERLEKLRGMLGTVHQEFSALGEGDVPRLVQECRESKVIRVLTGDYNLKLARQDYFTANQEKVIRHLVVQRSRNEFLTMALEVELRAHREIHHILTSLYAQLSSQFQLWQARMVWCDVRQCPDPGPTQAGNDDSSDRAGSQLFLTYDVLVENARTLRHRHDQLTRTLNTTNSGDADHLHLLERSVSQCEDLLYSESSTASGAPPLTPRPLQQAIIQLGDLLKQLEQNILNLVKDIDQKKKLLKSDPLLARERKLFTYFFTNPAKLQQTLEDISNRLQAKTHMDKS
ncbi:HAUS3-like protein [Mya arenaria]|uniref:HAUS3-like protein n=1 Tax=Mya arenaria TaxID=6604 RepID=A0ABY7FNV5_MYAAR|nr:HAUS3-like protein [Mya arenaria]